MSYSTGAWPLTPESAAPTALAMVAAAARKDGTALIAGVPPGSPAFRPVKYCTVFPSALT